MEQRKLSNNPRNKLYNSEIKNKNDISQGFNNNIHNSDTNDFSKKYISLRIKALTGFGERLKKAKYVFIHLFQLLLILLLLSLQS